MVNLHFGSSLMRFHSSHRHARCIAATHGVAKHFFRRKMENRLKKIFLVYRRNITKMIVTHFAESQFEIQPTIVNSPCQLANAKQAR